jgi:hypothetical protein
VDMSCLALVRVHRTGNILAPGEEATALDIGAFYEGN